MTQPVIFPAVNVASSTGTLPVVENSTELQGATEAFSGLLALLSGSLGNPPVTGEVLQVTIEGKQVADNGQDLPSEELIDGNNGESLPLLAGTSIEALEIADKAPATTVSAAIKTILVKEAPQEITLDESSLEEEPVIATGLPQTSIDTTIPPAITQPLLTEQTKLEIPASGMLLQEQSVRHQGFNQLENRELIGKQIPLTVNANEMDDALQTAKTISEELIKPVVRTATPPIDSSIIMQDLRRISTPVTGSEISNRHDLTSVLSAVQTMAPVPAQNSTQVLPSLSLNTPFQNAGWNQEVTDKIQWMVNQRIQGAEIKLNPAHLGPMEVKVQMQNDQVTVQFTAAHSIVRDALEAAIPRLKEMFENQGVQLADVDVSEESFTHQRQAREENLSHHSAGSLENKVDQSIEDGPVERWSTAVSVAGRLDLFA
ncbi:MAG: flagellar hook-length control protein FliK [Gammaproteobacteria bacterium]